MFIVWRLEAKNTYEACRGLVDVNAHNTFVYGASSAVFNGIPRDRVQRALHKEVLCHAAVPRDVDISEFVNVEKVDTNPSLLRVFQRA